MIEKDLNKVLNYMKQYVENKYEHDSEPMLNYKDIDLVLKEISRLNNIIDELEKWLKDEANFWKQEQEKAIKNGWLEFGGKYNTTIIYENAINKLKELKESE